MRLDPLGALIVMHLAWRDAPSLRTDRGIAAALNQHRSSVQKATARLAALGLIARRSGQWVACETIAIVEQSPSAPRPSADASDDSDGHAEGVARPTEWATKGDASPRPTEWAGGGPLSGPQVAYTVGHMRKEKLEKGAGSKSARSRAPSRGASRPDTLAGIDPGKLSAFQVHQIRLGRSLLVAGVLVSPGSAEAAQLSRAIAENGGR